LEDKLSPVQTQHPRQVLFKDRAEIIQFNQCYGNGQQLSRQFNEVRLLRPGMYLPVLSISFSFSPGERLAISALTDIATGCAKHFGFDQHQFVTILHKDTPQQHIHIVANRVGFDRRAVSDSHAYVRIGDYCRQVERQYELRQVIDRRLYQSQEQSPVDRHSIRLDKLREHIQQTLLTAQDYPEFEQTMQRHGYTVYRQQRGIAFMDEKRIFIKGSAMGYPLRAIEGALSQSLVQRQQKESLRLQQELHQEQVLQRRQAQELQQEEETHQRISHDLHL
jgi:signal transduction histidine kinase